MVIFLTILNDICQFKKTGGGSLAKSLIESYNSMVLTIGSKVTTF